MHGKWHLFPKAGDWALTQFKKAQTNVLSTNPPLNRREGQVATARRRPYIQKTRKLGVAKGRPLPKEAYL